MVVIFLPSTAATGITQERTAAPSRCTVQAPHCAMPHPYLVPVRPACSRIAHNSGVLGSTLSSTVFPLIVNRAMASSRNCGARQVPRYFEILTRVTALTRLLASTKSPSRVTDVFRTMLPPPGIAQLWNFSVFGSKRTIVFGVVPDSLYQTTSLIAEIPYGSDLGPLGDGHSVTLPLAGSRRPR